MILLRFSCCTDLKPNSNDQKLRVLALGVSKQLLAVAVEVEVIPLCRYEREERLRLARMVYAMRRVEAAFVTDPNPVD